MFMLARGLEFRCRTSNTNLLAASPINRATPSEVRRIPARLTDHRGFGSPPVKYFLPRRTRNATSRIRQPKPIPKNQSVPLKLKGSDDLNKGTPGKYRIAFTNYKGNSRRLLAGDKLRRLQAAISSIGAMRRR